MSNSGVVLEKWTFSRPKIILCTNDFYIKKLNITYLKQVTGEGDDKLSNLS